MAIEIPCFKTRFVYAFNVTVMNKLILLVFVLLVSVNVALFWQSSQAQAVQSTSLHSLRLDRKGSWAATAVVMPGTLINQN
jgi:hypothetical protein